jgi:hypothetical protein
MRFSLLLLDGAPFCFNYRLNSLIGGLLLVLLLLLILCEIERKANKITSCRVCGCRKDGLVVAASL